MTVKELIKELQELDGQNDEIEVLLDGQIVGGVISANDDVDGAYLEIDSEEG